MSYEMLKMASDDSGDSSLLKTVLRAGTDATGGLVGAAAGSLGSGMLTDRYVNKPVRLYEHYSASIPKWERTIAEHEADPFLTYNPVKMREVDDRKRWIPKGKAVLNEIGNVEKLQKLIPHVRKLRMVGTLGGGALGALGLDWLFRRGSDK